MWTNVKLDSYYYITIVENIYVPKKKMSSSSVKNVIYKIIYI